MFSQFSIHSTFYRFVKFDKFDRWNYGKLRLCDTNLRGEPVFTQRKRLRFPVNFKVQSVCTHH